MSSNQLPKRPRLDSWGDSPILHLETNTPHYVNVSAHSQYSDPSVMDIWETKNTILQPGQHTISNSRSQTTGTSSISPPALYTTTAHIRRASSDLSPSADGSKSYSGYQASNGASRDSPRQSFHDPSSFYPSHHPPVEMSGSGVSPTVTGPGVGNYGGIQPSAPGGGATVANVGTTYPPRRKAIRAAQACDACRARKAKCDEGRPSCGFCKESGVQCVYREVPPPKQDRTLLQILDRLGRVESLLDNLNSNSSQERVIRNGSVSGTPKTQISDTQQATSVATARLVQPATSIDEYDEDLSIPYQHTTAAHKLFWWPSIRSLIEEGLLSQETYVIDEEESRGMLRLYGRGEGPGSGDPMFDDDSDGEYITADQRGSIPPSYGNPTVGEDGIEDEPGRLKLDRQTMIELLNSYLANIHILHPILDTASITETVLKFAGRFNPPPTDSPAGPWAPDEPMPSPRSHRTGSYSGGKRKRSSSMSGIHHIGGSSRPQNIPRTIHSVLVLLVLALGSMCLHRCPVPGPVPRTQFSSPPAYAASPYKTTTPTPPYSAGTPPYAQHPPQHVGCQLRNMDVLPGLAYFAKALDIMGGLMGSNELESVQAGLLAGLYFSQCARVLDSWRWISWACMGCQILIRMKLPMEKNELKKDLILRAFWSCLQLESDVLAELDLPPSGISRLEDSMMLPCGVTSAAHQYTEVREDDPLIWMYYLAQIALRKLLNRVHTALYKQGPPPSSSSTCASPHAGSSLTLAVDKMSRLDSPRSLAIAKELDYQLEQWKAHLPEQLRWDESDAPSGDINAARLRAKYFGARYIIHRPFIYHALHHDSTSTEDPTELDNYCRKCIESAVQSTTAFHAFNPDNNRPIITNVFGTAHAQFGNLLVLQAVYQCQALRPVVPAHVLSSLLTKTMHWFQTLAPISPPLRRDRIILENTAAKLDFALQHY